MNRRKVLFLVVAITFLFFIFYLSLENIDKSENRFIEGKTKIEIIYPKDISKENFISFIYEIADEYSTEIIYQYPDKGTGYTFYSTGIKNKLIYSSAPQINEKRLYGFFNKDFVIKYSALENLAVLDDLYLSGNYYIEDEIYKVFTNRLNEYGIEYSVDKNEKEIYINEELILISSISILFCIISILFFISSRMKAIAILKSCGYGNAETAMTEMECCIREFAYIFLSIILLSVCLLSIRYGLASTLLFLVRYIGIITGFYCGIVIIYFVITLYLSTLCSSEVLNGKNFNKELSVLFLGAKIFAFMLLFAFLVIAVDNLTTALKEYKITVENYEKVKPYAIIEVYDSEDSEDIRESMLEKYVEFYHILEVDYGLIIANLHYIDSFMVQYGAQSFKRADVNYNYIAESERLYNIDGTKLSVNQLDKNKVNILIPEKFFSDEMPVSSLINCDATGCEINYIRYSKESEFFTYNNDTELDNDGYSRDVVVEVFDPDLLLKYCPGLIASDDIHAAFTWGALFKYDVQSMKTPYEQLYKVIKEANLHAEAFSAVKAENQFYENLSDLKRSLIIDLLGIVALISAIILFSFEYASLYYLINSKRICSKILSGYNYFDIFRREIIRKLLLVLPLILEYIFLKDMYQCDLSYGVVLCLGCVIIDEMIFALFMKIIYGRHLAGVMNGE